MMLSIVQLEAAKQSIAAELESMEMQPVPELLLTELIHQAAYRNNTLGLPNLCPSEDITRMTTNDLWKFYSTYMKPSRMVLVGVNVEHEELVELAQQHFVSPDTSWEGKGDIEVDTSISQYTGGEVKVLPSSFLSCVVSSFLFLLIVGSRGTTCCWS